MNAFKTLGGLAALSLTTTAIPMAHADAEATQQPASTTEGKELSVENATSGMAAPFHAGAAKYFAEKGVTVETK